MNTENIRQVYVLDKEGKPQEAFDLICALAQENDPLALFELSTRYFPLQERPPEMLSIEQDEQKSKTYAISGKAELQKLADNNDGEAMRMLAYLYLGHLCPYPRDLKEAENWLLKSIDAGSDVAANDLAIFYQNTNIEKARYWYQYAQEKGCRLIHNEELETLGT